jgi:DNA ligase-1
MVHDFIPADDETMPFDERYYIASAYVEALGHPKVRIAPIIGLGDYNEVQRQAELIWARRSTDKSDEGAIGKRTRAPFSGGKRNKDIIKVKSEVTLDMEVIGVERGQGKYEYTAGKLAVRQKNGQTHSISGMTEAERDLWWENQHLIIGKVVEVQAMQVLENCSLREGRFKAVRHDKTVDEID